MDWSILNIVNGVGVGCLTAVVFLLAAMLSRREDESKVRAIMLLVNITLVGLVLISGTVWWKLQEISAALHVVLH